MVVSEVRFGAPRQIQERAGGHEDGEDNMWAVPAVMKLVADHNRSLSKEPPIRLGTPDPYKPAN